MRRYGFALLGLVGAALLFFLVPLFDAAQPRGLWITRKKAREVADAEVRKLGVDPGTAYAVTVWDGSDPIEKELANDPARRRRADQDPVVSTMLGGYLVTYFRPGLEKRPEFAVVVVGKKGEVVLAVKRGRAEDPGASPQPEALRPRADAFVKEHLLPGWPEPAFEVVRPTVLRNRIDHAFRYRVPTAFPLGPVAVYFTVSFIGDQVAGWTVDEEYADGRRFRGAAGENVAGTFLRFGILFSLNVVLLVIYLRKYHAGEVGVSTGALVFAAAILLALGFAFCLGPWPGYGTQMGGLDASRTTWAVAGFKFLFNDIPLAVLAFLAWSVGESIARERWGDRLASFDAVLRRDPVNATVGRSLTRGVLAAPAIAAAALLPVAIPVRLGSAHGVLGPWSEMIVNSAGAALTPVLSSAIDALLFSTVGLLFLMGALHRRRLLLVGILLAAAFGCGMSILPPPVAPLVWVLKLGFGGCLATAGVFLASDLLAAATALFAGGLVLAFVPYLRAVSGPAAFGPLVWLAGPVAFLLILGLVGLATRREVAYTYADLAVHVKRIVERERIKAEIDAANRIQAALLPSKEPNRAGTSVASHYRAATEIGGDYFDFLDLADGSLGLAFGDVSGHGLTSGIVMAMTKSALLVQVGYDASPVRVMEVLNQTVMKTAPKRILMTFFYGVLETESGVLRFCSAGHLDPYVYRVATGRLEALSAWGFPLGVRRREPFREQTATFDPGDRLVLYSDGLIEALDDDGEPFGFERFEKVLVEKGAKSATEIRKALLDSVKTFTRNRPPEDDQTLVIVSFEDVAEAYSRKAS